MLETSNSRPSLSGLIRPQTICMNLKGQTKQEVIDELIDILDSAGDITDKTAVRQAVIERERRLSTGLGHGVAVPHGKTSGVKELVGAFGIKKEGVLFDAADGEPARIFFMLVSPQSVTGPHVKALAQAAKFLRVEKIREKILKAGSPEDILKIFELE